jgi:hypothetical protein
MRHFQLGHDIATSIAFGHQMDNRFISGVAVFVLGCSLDCNRSRR